MTAEEHNDDHYLLCRPRGGLNDTLCQIGECWEYAELTNRILIIDAKNSCFHGGLSDYFEPRVPSDRIFFDLTDEKLAILNTLSCFPAEVQGRLDTYRGKYVQKLHNFVDADSLAQLAFKFYRSYREKVIVHDQCGGGISSLFAIERLVISRKIRQLILTRLGNLKEHYAAVHIRNTDYQTNYQTFFERIFKNVEDRHLLVCSDDAKVIAFAKTFFTASKILSSSTIIDNGGKPLHHGFADIPDRRKQALDMIVDLFALGRSARLFIAPIDKVNGAPLHKVNGVARLSGFSILALHLYENKNVIDDILQVPVSQKSTIRWRAELLEKSLQTLVNSCLGFKFIPNVNTMSYIKHLSRRCRLL